jgi:hypothetical protein
MKIWLDDERPAPDGWERVYTAAQAIFYLDKCLTISLDNDLGEGLTEGYVVMNEIERRAFLGEKIPDEIYIHTANVCARKRMEQTLANINKYKKSTRMDKPNPEVFPGYGTTCTHTIGLYKSGRCRCCGYRLMDSLRTRAHRYRLQYLIRDL